MSIWVTKNIYSSKSLGFNIIGAQFKKGDIFSAQTVNQNSTGGLTFLSSGSINAYDVNMDLRVQHSYEDGKILVPPLGENETLTECGERIINMAATEDGGYYCITGSDSLWDGEVINLIPGESANISEVKDKRLFLASNGISINGIAYKKNEVILCDTVDTVTVKAGQEPAVLAVFYKQ